MEDGEAGSLVFTVLSVSASKSATPCRRPRMVRSVWISSAPGKLIFSFVSACRSWSLVKASMPGIKMMY